MQRTSKLVLCFALAGGITAGAEKHAVTFTSDVAPILVKSCVTCHRPGEFHRIEPWEKRR